MRILLLYGTNSGGTQAVAGYVAAALRKRHHQVRVLRANTRTVPRLERYDLIILGSCSWLHVEKGQSLEGQLQEHMFDVTKRLIRRTPPHRPFAIFALGDSSYTNFCGAADRLEEFVRRVEGSLLLPALRIDGFYFALERNRQRAERWGERLAKTLAQRKAR